MSGDCGHGWGYHYDGASGPCYRCIEERNRRLRTFPPRLIARLVTIENDPTVPAYARKVAADAVRAMGGANADPT